MAACAVVLPNVAAAVAVGSLAPHDPTQNGRPSQQWIADPKTHCIAADPNYDPADSISWAGPCKRNGMIYGTGTLTFLNNGRMLQTIKGTFMDGMPAPGRLVATWSDGTKYEGDQLGYLFNGTGKFVSRKGETFDGEWKLGVLNGKASALWANGDRYDGEWKNGKSDGQGVEVWADGRRYEGEWRDGVALANTDSTNTLTQNTPWVASSPAADTSAGSSAPATATAAPLPLVKAAAFVPPVAISGASAGAPTVTKTAAAATRDGQPATVFVPLRSVMGTQLTAVDGATLELGTIDGGFARTLVLPNGNSQEIQFAFVNGPVGTVTVAEKAIGVFRARSGQLDIDYADGTTESVGEAATGGLFDRAQMIDGRTMCTSWYPRGHEFSDTEKKAAVQEYANRLGVQVSAPPAKNSPHASAETCGGAFIASGNERKPGDAKAANVRPVQRPQTDEQALLRSGPDATVGLNTSAVHLVDNPATSSMPAARVEQASFAPGTALAPTHVVPAGLQPAAAQPGASDCLSVTSNGDYWGFQNRCAKSVQFSYCEMGDANPLTTCKRTSVSGSVAANSFSALVSDRSLSEKSVNHEFRWMACDGGAGEVVPHLDKIDPPSGRCERAMPPAS